MTIETCAEQLESRLALQGGWSGSWGQVEAKAVTAEQSGEGPGQGQGLEKQEDLGRMGFPGELGSTS